MFQDDINSSSFDTSYSTKLSFLTLWFVSNHIIITACESSNNRKIKLVNACESITSKTAIGNSLCHYSIISRLSSIYGTSDGLESHINFCPLYCL